MIRSVAMEEMLHMTLAANVLNAIGGEPCVNKAAFIPVYPTTLPHSDGAFLVGLEKFSPQAVETFLKIEHPAGADDPPQADHYHTIGQFYAAIEQGLRNVCSGDKHFTRDASRQVTPEYFYGGGGNLVVVSDLKSALKALEEIVDQGEGHDHSLSEGDTPVLEDGEGYAHYYRFNEIHTGRYYHGDDTPATGPRGRPFFVAWDAVYDMRPNPKISDYPPGSDLRRKSEDFSRAYTLLLDQLHDAFNGAPGVLVEAVATMYDLKYKAAALFNTPSPTGDTTAGPKLRVRSSHRGGGPVGAAACAWGSMHTPPRPQGAKGLPPGRRVVPTLDRGPRGDDGDRARRRGKETCHEWGTNGARIIRIPFDFCAGRGAKPQAAEGNDGAGFRCNTYNTLHT